MNAFLLSEVIPGFRRSGLKWLHILGFCLNIIRANRSSMEILSLKMIFLYNGCSWSCWWSQRHHPWLVLLESQGPNDTVERTADWRVWRWKCEFSVCHCLAVWSWAHIECPWALISLPTKWWIRWFPIPKVHSNYNLPWLVIPFMESLHQNWGTMYLWGEFRLISLTLFLKGLGQI